MQPAFYAVYNQFLIYSSFISIICSFLCGKETFAIRDDDLRVKGKAWKKQSKISSTGWLVQLLRLWGHLICRDVCAGVQPGDGKKSKPVLSPGVSCHKQREVLFSSL